MVIQEELRFIGYVAGYVLAFVFIGFLVLLAVGVVIIVFGIIAAIAANRGEEYYYPVAIKFLN